MANGRMLINEVTNAMNAGVVLSEPFTDINPVRKTNLNLTYDGSALETSERNLPDPNNGFLVIKH
ncbi:MAG: hypothetical protein KTR35_16935 [Gammaproteobacteria bacterium]|nr:hypothetical protein [Gammaproteobacteria bacterium]